MSSSFNSLIGSRTLTLETGKLAQQANGSVLASYGDTVLLITATMAKPREGIDFFPLTIDFEERLYARGKIPGSFFRREGRPSTHAILIDRLTDRSVRPLFPKGFRNEVQIIITTLSTDQENPLDILTISGASAALAISDIPFEGPIGATRIGYVNGELVVNPTYLEMEESELDLVVSGTRDGVLMMEAGAHELPEDLVLRAIERAQEANQQVIELQEEMVRSVGKTKVEFDVESAPEDLSGRVIARTGQRLSAVLETSSDNGDQSSQLDSLKTGVVEELGEDYQASDIKDAFEALQKSSVRERMLDRGLRPDGRGLRDIRELSCEVGLLPRTHGSGLFSRGETQVLCVATLGSVGDAQRLDSLSPEESKRFLLHYNFPPYSVGEARRVGTPGRREIGHGALAERALTPVLPSAEDFPYTIRLVSEVLSSNGSTSMGSVCASTLALMDTGVPIKTPIAGISIGLIAGQNGNYVILTDIQGLEDHLGDMDFKVAGSNAGITAIQLDIKIKSIGFDVIRDALAQAKEARLQILERIRETISESRPEMSPYAPRMVVVKIPVDKIGLVIGPGGKTIRSIIEQTNATVDVQDDGSVYVGSADADASKRAVELITNLTKEIQVGEIYTGKVVKITNFGAFVELVPGKDGLVHISELADHHVPTVEDVVQVGEEITVIVREIDSMGRVSLSRRALLEGNDDSPDGPASQPAESQRQRGPASGQGQSPVEGGRPGGDRGGYRPQQGPRRGGQGQGGRSGPRRFDRRPPG